MTSFDVVHSTLDTCYDSGHPLSVDHVHESRQPLQTRTATEKWQQFVSMVTYTEAENMLKCFLR